MLRKSPINKTVLSLVMALVVVVGIRFGGFSRASAVVGDVNADGLVNVTDLSLLLAAWGTANTAADLNKDTHVDIFDLSLLLSHWGNTAPPAATPTPVPVPTSSPLPQLGFTIHTDTLPPSTRLSDFQHLAAIGAKWIRVGAPWYKLQPDNASTWSSTGWADIDATFNAATAAGINVLFEVGEAPSWATTPDAQGAPRDVPDFGVYVGVVAKRYAHAGPGGASPAIEVLNEANSINSNGVMEASPSQLVQLTCAAHSNLQTAAPGTTIITGSANMVIPDQTDPSKLSWPIWLDQAYQDGLGPCIDALSIHPYGISPTDMSGFRSIMTKYGDGQKPAWITEYGETTCTAANSGCVTEAVQATRLTDQIHAIQNNYPWVPVAMIYDDRDNPAYYPGQEGSYGLFHVDSSNQITTAKPAADAVKQIYLP